MTRKEKQALRNRTPAQYEAAEFATIGWIQITEIREENVYFTLADGTRGFVKLG